jgi:hypothetical protein
MGTVRRHLQLIGAPAVLLLCAACGSQVTGGGTSNASCVGPYLDDQPPTGVFGGPHRTVAPGDSITIHGHWYTNTCNDTGGHDPLEPLAPVHLILTLPGGTAKELGTFDPGGPDMGFSTAVHVPAATPAGTATIRDDRQDPATYRFEVSR